MKVLGFMTGTSLDGIDLALLDTDGETIQAFGPWAEYPMPARVRDVLEGAVRAALSWPRGAAEPQVFDEARRILVGFHLEAADQFLRHNGLTFKDIDLAGVHGQTVLHERPRKEGTWVQTGRTVQLFDGAAFADTAGVRVVSEFRQADVAAGGEGAPLAPVYHRALVEKAGLELPVIVVNLGGVANITVVTSDGLAALDTGPANGLMDQWMRQHGRGDYDHGGRLAAAGRVDEAVVAAYLNHPYFSAPAPKSLDRYDFSLDRVQGMSLEDGLATLSAFTVRSLMAGIDLTGIEPKTVALAGGGRHNSHLVEGITSALAAAQVVTAEALGWRGGALEAEAFAYMAARVVRGLPISFPGTTGVAEPLTGGVVSTPRPRQTAA